MYEYNKWYFVVKRHQCVIVKITKCTWQEYWGALTYHKYNYRMSFASTERLNYKTYTDTNNNKKYCIKKINQSYSFKILLEIEFNNKSREFYDTIITMIINSDMRNTGIDILLKSGYVKKVIRNTH